MTKGQLNILALPVLALSACSAPNDSAQDTSAAATSGEWVSLFDGSDLGRFNVVGDANWRITNDYVEADSGNGFLVSDLDYDNFELRLEFWVDVPANSGVFIRCQNPEEIGADSCYEVNIYDTRPNQDYRTGGIVNVAIPTSVINTGGRWNSYEIIADGSHLLVTLNGTLTVDVEDDAMSSGPFALQYGAGKVIFRNVQVRSR